MNSDAMWLIVVWQLAQMTADVSWKSMRACGLTCLPWMLVNGNLPVNVPAPIGTGLSEYSAGNFEQAKVSWKKRTRRNAMFEKYCACRPGS